MSQERATGFQSHVQGLRAFAVLAVVLFHAGLPLPGGFTGVDVFFVISGYVITAMLAREYAVSGRIRLRSFYWRRIKRIAPSLATVLLATVTASFFLLSPFGAQQNTSLTALAATLSIANWAIATLTGGYFGAAADMNPLLHTWSLSVEEQFYLFFPTLLALAWWVARRRKRAHPLLALAIVSALSLWTALTPVLADNLPEGWLWIGEFYGPVPRVWEFGVGAMLALWGGAELQSARRRQVAAWVGAALLIGSMLAIRGSMQFPGIATLFPVAGAALVIFAGPESSWVGKLLSTRPAVYIGDISYSLYLRHWPFIVFAKLLWPQEPSAPLIAAALSVLPSIAAYKFIEQPFRKREWVRPKLTLAAMATVIIAPLALSSVQYTLSNAGYGDQAVQDFEAERAPRHLGISSGCVYDPASPNFDNPACQLNPTARNVPIYLVGDSNGDHFSEGLLAAAKQTDRPFSIAVSYGCPFIDVGNYRLDKTARENRRCRTWAHDALDWLKSRPKGLVIVANSDRIWSDPNWRIRAKGGELTSSPQEKQLLVLAGLAATLREIQSFGHQVLLVQTIPHFGEVDPWNPDPYGWDPTQCTFASNAAIPCVKLMPLGYADEQQAASRAVITATAETLGVRLVDLRDAICPRLQCLTWRDGRLIYRDAAHISVNESQSLAANWLPYLTQS